MKKRVFAADASMSLLETIKIAFQSAGFDVYTSRSGKDMMPLVQEIEPDAVLLGTSLPEEGAYKLARQLRGLSRFRHIPLFFMAGTLEKIKKDKLSGLVFEDLIRTPFNSDALAFRVKQILEEKASPPSLPEEPESLDFTGKEEEVREIISRLVKEEVLEAERELEKRLLTRLRSEIQAQTEEKNKSGNF
jgi:DNA-binding response OmpR family regulator